MLSKKAKYGIKALLRLARDGQHGPLQSSQLAIAEGIPRKFLELILVQLKNQGILLSRRGRGGGYSLRVPAEEITIACVVRLFDGPLAPVPCASEHYYQRCEECLDERSCGVRLVMKDVRDAVAHILEGTTVADLARRADTEIAAMDALHVRRPA